LIKDFGSLDESIISAYTAQTLEGLDYLHSSGIAHRDIKCANLLLSDNGCIKIADFGTSKYISSIESSFTSDQEQVLTDRYICFSLPLEMYIE